MQPTLRLLPGSLKSHSDSHPLFPYLADLWFGQWPLFTTGSIRRSEGGEGGREENEESKRANQVVLVGRGRHHHPRQTFLLIEFVSGGNAEKTSSLSINDHASLWTGAIYWPTESVFQGRTKAPLSRDASCLRLRIKATYSYMCPPSDFEPCFLPPATNPPCSTHGVGLWDIYCPLNCGKSVVEEKTKNFRRS